MKPTACLAKTYTVEGLSQDHCVLLYALLASYRLGTSRYSVLSLELIEMLESLDLVIPNDIELVMIPEDFCGDSLGRETTDFILELKNEHSN